MGIPDTFKSKSFISTIVLLLMTIIVAYVPDLKDVSDMMVNDVTNVILALIAGHKLKDVLVEWINRRYPQSDENPAG